MKQARMNMNRVTGCRDVCDWMECTVSKETFSVCGLRFEMVSDLSLELGIYKSRFGTHQVKCKSYMIQILPSVAYTHHTILGER